MDLGGHSVLSWVRKGVDCSNFVDDFVIATTLDPVDDAIIEWCEDMGVKYWRGSEDDVLSRFVGAARDAQADVAVRVTCDCPFIDPTVIDQVIALREATGADYASNISPPTWPDGLDCEAITIEALEYADREAARKIDRECVTTYIQRNQHRFKAVNLTCPIPGMQHERWVLDTENDYKLCQQIAENAPATGWLDIKRYLDQNPDLRDMNKMHPRNERYYEALNTEALPARSYSTSRRLLKEAEQTIPLGAQTFSKSRLQYPTKAPLFLTHGDGAYVFDVDGNEYVDLVAGLLPVILGYRDPDVDYAIRAQLDRGISFSLSTELESELAEKLTSLIPCAEMVRFGKNGTDVTTAAVRLARAHTKREHILICNGYHGWNDWSVTGTVRGIGAGWSPYTQRVTYGDLEFTEELLSNGLYAACIVEPETDPVYLTKLRELTHKYGTVLIFDEVITGFRWSMGGAQARFGITPDLATFGKAMGNGMPISAIVGSKSIMSRMAPPNNIFYSGTMFGEALSLAAAIATVDKLERLEVPKALKGASTYLEMKAATLIEQHGLQEVVTLHGSAPLVRLKFKDPEGIFTPDEIRALFIQEMARQGVLIIVSHNLCHAVGMPEMKRIRTAYGHTLATIKVALENGMVREWTDDSKIEQTIRGAA